MFALQMEKSMKTITLRVPEVLESRIAGLARDRGTSKSAVVREAVETYLNEATEGRTGSMSERVEDLLGAIDGPHAPTDLASNEKHLEGYGQ